jgi:malate/lactate dehydrogenase
MSVVTDGKVYGVPKDLIFSFPCTCDKGTYKVVEGLKLNEFTQRGIDATTKELMSERDAVESMLKH